MHKPSLQMCVCMNVCVCVHACVCVCMCMCVCVCHPLVTVGSHTPPPPPTHLQHTYTQQTHTHTYIVLEAHSHTINLPPTHLPRNASVFQYSFALSPHVVNGPDYPHHVTVRVPAYTGGGGGLTSKAKKSKGRVQSPSHPSPIYRQGGYVHPHPHPHTCARETQRETTKQWKKMGHKLWGRGAFLRSFLLLKDQLGTVHTL